MRRIYNFPLCGSVSVWRIPLRQRARLSLAKKFRATNAVMNRLALQAVRACGF